MRISDWSSDVCSSDLPLHPLLINELLPKVTTLLPRDLAARKLPSELCDYLNRDPQSPFHRLIRRVSDAEPGTAVVTDSAIVDAIKRNLKPPMGALSQYKQNGAESDPDAMYRALVLYWTAVLDTFP